MKEENPMFLAQASSPSRMGFQELSLHFRAEGKVLEHPSGHVLTLSWTVTFTSLQDGETAFQSTTPGEDAGTCQLALTLWEVFWISGKHGLPRHSVSLKLMELYKRVKTSTCLYAYKQDLSQKASTICLAHRRYPANQASWQGSVDSLGPLLQLAHGICSWKRDILTMHAPFFLNTMKGETLCWPL